VDARNYRERTSRDFIVLLTQQPVQRTHGERSEGVGEVAAHAAMRLPLLLLRTYHCDYESPANLAQRDDRGYPQKYGAKSIPLDFVAQGVGRRTPEILDYVARLEQQGIVRGEGDMVHLTEEAVSN
jgi:hypothetical protein